MRRQYLEESKRDIAYESGMQPGDRLSQANVMMHIQQIGESYDNDIIADRTSSIPVEGQEEEEEENVVPKNKSPKKKISQKTTEVVENEFEDLDDFHKDIYGKQAEAVDFVTEIKNDTHQNVDWRFGTN